jgi:hypothetical protein
LVTNLPSIPSSGASFSSIGIEEAPSRVAESIIIINQNKTKGKLDIEKKYVQTKVKQIELVPVRVNHQKPEPKNVKRSKPVSCNTNVKSRTRISSKMPPRKDVKTSKLRKPLHLAPFKNNPYSESEPNSSLPQSQNISLQQDLDENRDPPKEFTIYQGKNKFFTTDTKIDIPPVCLPQTAKIAIPLPKIITSNSSCESLNLIEH